MPTYQQIIINIKQKVAKNALSAIKHLSEIIDPKSDNSNILIMLEQQFIQLKKNNIIGLFDAAEYDRKKADINNKLLSFISDLNEEDLLLTKLMQYETPEHILVITKSKERKIYMQQFFPEDYFRSMSYNDSGKPIELSEEIDIIVYDDKPAPDKDQTDELLLHYLMQPKIVVLYFGRMSPLVYQYPEKAYATNSVFSIHARIKEMIEYLKYKEAFDAKKK